MAFCWEAPLCRSRIGVDPEVIVGASKERWSLARVDVSYCLFPFPVLPIMVEMRPGWLKQCFIVAPI